MHDTKPKTGIEVLRAAFPNNRTLWQVCERSDRRFTLEALSINGCIVIVQEFSGNNGWDVYVQASPRNGRIDATLTAIGNVVEVEPIQPSQDEPTV